MDVYLILQYTRQGLHAPTYKVSDSVRLSCLKQCHLSGSHCGLVAPTTADELKTAFCVGLLISAKLRYVSDKILICKLLKACWRLQTLGSVRAMPDNGTALLRGVFSLEPEADLSSASIYLETAHPGMTFPDFTAPKFYLATDLSSKAVVPNMPNVTDEYSPCAIMPDHGYTVVYEVELPAGSNSSDNLNIFMCSPGGYDQVSASTLMPQLKHPATSMLHWQGPAV